MGVGVGMVVGGRVTVVRVVTGMLVKMVPPLLVAVFSDGTVI